MTESTQLFFLENVLCQLNRRAQSYVKSQKGSNNFPGIYRESIFGFDGGQFTYFVHMHLK